MLAATSVIPLEECGGKNPVSGKFRHGRTVIGTDRLLACDKLSNRGQVESNN
jgi:hypothetical protein